MTRYVLDIETNGLLSELDRVHCLVLRHVETGEMISCANQPGYPSIEAGLDYIAEAKQLVGHSLLKFDLPVLRKLYPNLILRPDCDVYDTLVVSRLLFPEIEAEDESKYSHIESKYKGRHSLAAWGERLGTAKIKFKNETPLAPGEKVWDNWSPAMQTYCEGDTLVSLELYNYMLTQEIDPRAFELEHEFCRIMAEQEKFGFPFNEKAAYALVNVLKARRTEIDDQLQEVFPPITEERISAKTGKPLKTKITPFNPGSRQQTAERLQLRYPEIVFGSTEKGNVKLDDDVLEKLGEKYPEAKILAEYQLLNERLGKIVDGKESWLHHCRVYGDGRIHGNVNTNSCVSGRVSHCIEENQLVTTREGEIPIKNVKIGQYVYSYNLAVELNLNKVTDVIDQGVQECYVLKWRAAGKAKESAIVCTENHKFLTWNRGMQPLKNLKIGERICHLSTHIVDGRKSLYMMNRKKIRQCTFIKENIYKKYGKRWHAHHVDFNKLNDSLDNIQILPAEEHAKLHHTGENNVNLLRVSKFALLRMIAIAQGHPTRINMDFETFKKKCIEVGIDLRAVRSRYSKITGKYITKRMVADMLDNNWTPYRAGSEFKITWAKWRIDALLRSHGIMNNHWVASIEYLGPRQTYDLSVERDHNFICQELCVSNSSPNVSQVPSVGSPFGAECRALFYAPEGWDLVGADASGLELRALAAWLAYFDDGVYAGLVSDPTVDIHAHNAALFGLYDPTRGAIPKTARDLSKRLTFGVLYGAGVKKAGSIIRPEASEDEQYRQGKVTIDTFYVNLPAIKKLKDLIDRRITQNGHLIGIDGRKLLIRSRHSALNQLLQSTGAILMKKATCIFWDTVIKAGLVPGDDFQPVGYFHDELQVLSLPQHSEFIAKSIVDGIRQSGEFFELKCPFTGEYRIGKNWEQTH